MTQDLLDEYRPYYDSEINAAMCRLSESPYFPALAAYVYPTRAPEDVKRQIRAYTTIRALPRRTRDLRNHFRQQPDAPAGCGRYWQIEQNVQNNPWRNGA
ncbi:MAG: hypothetical protein LBR51_02510 [Bacteroidales bacterium]|nr:hypothetical protein [Bacteroidales bacterium]